MNLSDVRPWCSTLFSNSRLIFRHMRSMKISSWSLDPMPGGKVPPSLPPTASHWLPASHQFRTLSLGKKSLSFFTAKIMSHLLYSITIPFICRSRIPEFIMIGFLRVTLRSLSKEHSLFSRDCKLCPYDFRNLWAFLTLCT